MSGVGSAFVRNPFSSAFNYQFGTGATTPKTAADIVQDALELLGIYSPGETATAPDLARGFSTLNAMLDSWSNEALSTFAYLTQQFTLSPGQSVYTIGPGGNIDAPRPLRLSDAAGSAYLLDQNANRYPLDVVDQQTWNLRTTSAVSSNLPDTLFYDPQMPLGLINIWPIPNIGYTAYFMAFAQLTFFASLIAPMVLPPGYYWALATNLAVVLKPYFKDAMLDPVLIAQAMESKGNVKRTNLRRAVAVYDPELIARGRSTYNIYRDSGVGLR